MSWQETCKLLKKNSYCSKCQLVQSNVGSKLLCQIVIFCPVATQAGVQFGDHACLFQSKLCNFFKLHISTLWFHVCEKGIWIFCCVDILTNVWNVARLGYESKISLLQKVLLCFLAVTIICIASQLCFLWCTVTTADVKCKILKPTRLFTDRIC